MPPLPDSEFQKLIAMRADVSWIWNSLIDMHKMARNKELPYFSSMDLARQMTENTALLGLNLTTQSQNLIFQEFLGICETTKTNREKAIEAGEKDVWKTYKYPYRQRKGGRDTHFDRRECHNVKGGFTVGMAMEPNPKNGKMKRREPLFIPYRQGIPKNTTAISIHFDAVEKRFYLIFKLKEKKARTLSDKVKTAKYAAIDLGQIRWAAVMTEDGKTLNLKGKGFRSIHRDVNKKLAFRQSRIDRKKKGSKNRHKEQKKKSLVLIKYHNQKNNFLHTNSRKVVNFLKLHAITKVFVGDCRSLTQKDSGGRQNQANSGWPIGEFFSMISYKAVTDGIKAEWMPERNSTRQCPDPTCKHHNKIKGRVYKCRKCGLIAHRDSVGCWNILSFSMETCGLKAPVFNSQFVAISNQKYLAPVSMKGMSGKFLSCRRNQQVASSAEQLRSVMDDRIVLPEDSDSSVTLRSSRREAAITGNDTDQTTRAWNVQEISKSSTTSVA
jgi:transposase